MLSVCLLICRRDIVYLFFSLSFYFYLYTHFFSCNVLACLFNSISSYLFIFGAKISPKNNSHWKNAVCVCVFFIKLFCFYPITIFLRILLFRSIRLAIEFRFLCVKWNFYNSRSMCCKLNAQNFKVGQNKCNFRNFICLFIFQAQLNCLYI